MQMSSRAHIDRIDPAAGISGGEVSIEFASLSPTDGKTLNVEFDGSPAPVFLNPGATSPPTSAQEKIPLKKPG